MESSPKRIHGETDEAAACTQWLVTCHEHGLGLAMLELNDFLLGRGFPDDGFSVEAVGPGIIKVECTEQPAGFGALGGRPMVWSRHRHPVHGVISVDPPESLFERLREAVSKMLGGIGVGAGGPAVQVRKIQGSTELSAGQIAVNLADALSPAGQGMPGLDLRRATQDPWILSVTLLRDQVYWGVGPLSLQWSPLCGGAYHYPKEKLRYSRAAAKLYEIFEVFPVPIHPPAGTLALDLGAAPGGWTGVLLECGYDVVAVDPGALDPALAKQPRVRHLRAKTEAARLDGFRFSLITCDANWDPQGAQAAIVRLNDQLIPDGFVIFTLKLIHDYKSSHGKKVSIKAVARQLKMATDFFRKYYEIRGLSQIFHNRAEVTFVLQKKNTLNPAKQKFDLKQ